MIRHLTAVSAVATAFLLVPASSGSASEPLQVSAPVKVSGSVSIPFPGCTPDNANGPHASVDPGNPKHISVTYLLGPSAGESIATSRDGGTSWSRVAAPGVTTCTGGDDGQVGDPMIATGAGGRVITTTGWVNNSPDLGVDYPNVKLLLNRSDDGRNFAAAVEPEPGGTDQRGPISFATGSNDDVLVAFERVHLVNQPDFDAKTGGYLFGVGGSLGVVRSTNGGTNWWPATLVPVPGLDSAAVGAPGTDLFTVGLVRSGNAVVLIGAMELTATLPLRAAGDGLREELFSVRSTDSGLTWSTPTIIGGYDAPSDVAGCCIPDAAVGTDGTVYVTWPHTELATGAWTAVDLSRSEDGGQTWSPAVTHSTDIGATGGSISQPAVAARPGGGVALFYYELQQVSESIDLVTPRVAVSSDSGVTWTSATLGSAFNVDAIAGGGNDGTALGPYQDLVATPTGYGAVVTRGAGAGEDVWWYRINAH